MADEALLVALSCSSRVLEFGLSGLGSDDPRLVLLSISVMYVELDALESSPIDIIDDIDASKLDVAD